jgi:hypothetical protein
MNHLRRKKKNLMSSFDTQVGGSHYKDLAIQPLEFIVKNGLDFLQGNVVKYVIRYKLKGGIEDLEKARHYLDMMIELEEKSLPQPNDRGYIEYPKVRDHS